MKAKPIRPRMRRRILVKQHPKALRRMRKQERRHQRRFARRQLKAELVRWDKFRQALPARERRLLPETPSSAFTYMTMAR